MSKAREAHAAAQTRPATSASRAAPNREATGREQAGREPLPPPRPFKPRRSLFILTGLVLVALLGIMVWLYFTTVYPNRNQRQPIETDSASLAPR